MKVDGKPYRTIWLGADGTTVQAIDQTLLPHRFVVRDSTTVEDAERAIRTMIVRGAPLIGATAAYGMALAMAADPSDAMLDARLPGAARHAPDRGQPALGARRPARPARAAAAGRAAPRPPTGAPPRSATRMSRSAARIGEHGLGARSAGSSRSGDRINALTHCNAGWLATVDWGTALAPIYQAHDAGIPIHVWVDETRPRNQGASLTAWELAKHGVPHTVIADNAGGHLMQRGQVDFCIVGTDRTTRRGDVCNKIGTYLKALAAHDNGVPFYVGLPYPTHRLDDRGRTRRSRSRSATPTRSRASPAAPTRARSSRSTCCPRAARPPIPPSTSRRRGWSRR